MRIRWTKPAVSDLTNICDYVEEHDGTPRAHRIALSIYESINGLKKFSHSGRPGRRPGTRELIFPGLPYLAIYVQNKRRGVAARRGHGTFGEIIPGETPITDGGYVVARGPIATVEIGIEVKVLAKAMIKQIDRVINDLRNQVVQFKRGGGNPICVAVVGINQAGSTVGYEGDRPFPTTGKQGFLHPFQEAPEAERRLQAEAAPEFDEFLVLRFKATNAPPYPFEWVNYNETRLDYAAALSRISARYQQRF